MCGKSMIKTAIAISIVFLISLGNLLAEDFGIGIRQSDTSLVPCLFFSVSELLTNTIDIREDQNSTVFITVSGKISHISSEKHYNSLRGTMFWELALMSNTKPIRYMADISYLTGKIFASKYITTEINTGVSCVWGNKRGKLLETSGWLFSSERYEELKFITVGLPLEARFYINFTDFTRIGMVAQANLNFEAPTASLGISLSLGTITKQEPVKKIKKRKRINID